MYHANTDEPTTRRICTACEAGERVIELHETQGGRVIYFARSSPPKLTQKAYWGKTCEN